MTLSFAEMRVSLICYCLISVLSLCDVREPDYENILYGGTIAWPVHHFSNQDEDILEAIKIALDCIKSRFGFQFLKYNTSELSYNISTFQKQKLVYTRDDRKPLLRDMTHEDGTQLPMSSLITFGYNYAFQIYVSFNRSVSRHNFIITMYPRGKFYIFTYTSDVSWLFFKDPFELQPGQSSISTQGSTRSFHLHNSKPQDSLPSKTCQHQTFHNLIEQFYCDTLTSKTYCVLESKLVYNITLMTYNIWNFNSKPRRGDVNYIDRIIRLGKVINSYQPDIIALQEVRFEKSKGGDFGPNQVKHLADMLKHYQFVYQPAQLQPNSLRDGRTEEGVAIFSRYPIISNHYLKLFRNQSNSADLHQRVCQHVEIVLPHQTKIHIFNTHLSLSHEARERSVVQIWDYIQQFEGTHVLMGDLNAEPREDAIQFLYHNTSLLDAWHHVHGHLQHKGCTYSTLEKTLTKRIDYILINKQHGLHIIDAGVLDDCKKGSKAASDHIPVVTTLGFT